MLRKQLNSMIEEHGKVETYKILIKKIEKLQEKMRGSTNIYHAIDIEHDILDCQAMLRWLKEEK